VADANGDLVRLTIDGVEIEVPKGTRLIDAVERAGVVVPRYCYHPGIPSRPAQCRVCLVEVEGQPKLQPSCVFEAQDEMVVKTASDQVRLARKSVIELLLLNHPLDCPICDAAGQCMLQDYAFETRQLDSRLKEEKQVQGRDRVADDILYFADRCIICTRCVRFMRDVADDDSLVVAQRGHKSYIDTFPGKDLNHPFQGNIVDVCPVGALVHEDFVFKARAWDMDNTPSICPGCSTGCSVSIDTKENQVVRLKPRFNPEVNSYWMCDYGRKHFVMSNRGVRAEVPLIREDGELRPTDWATALDRVAGRLAELRSVPTDVGGESIVSAFSGNESLFYLRRLLDYLGIDGGAFRVETGDTATLAGFPKLQLRAERAPNGNGAESLGYGRVTQFPEAPQGVLIVLEDALHWAPGEYGSDASFFLYLGSSLTPATRNADVILPVSSFAESNGTVSNFEGRVQRYRQALQPPGIARPAWLVLSRLLAELGEGEAVLTAGGAFQVMAAESPAFGGLVWSELGLRGAIPHNGAAVEAEVT
jgi:NADH-quinone oxidoreductase subunit G